MKLIKFYADWCQPCKQMDNIMRGMEYTSVDVETEEGNALARRYAVRGLPTLVLTYDDGAPYETRTGIQSRQTIAEWVTAGEALEGADD